MYLSAERGMETGSGYAKIFNPSRSGWGRSRCTQKNYDDFANSYPGDYRLKKSFTIEDIKKDNYAPFH